MTARKLAVISTSVAETSLPHCLSAIVSAGIMRALLGASISPAHRLPSALVTLTPAGHAPGELTPLFYTTSVPQVWTSP